MLGPGRELLRQVTWTGSPGIQDAFTYLPWTAVLLAPGRWLAGDVRWALLVWTLVAAVGVWVLATRVPRGHTAYGPGPGPRWRGGGSRGPAPVRPGHADPGRPGMDRAAAAGGHRLVGGAGRPRHGQSAWWAVVPLALACASKQHLALLLPVLLLWRPFGVWRTLATGALTGLLIAPWFLAGPADFLHDTVTLLVSFPPLKFANTLYLLALNTFGVTLPFWVTGLVVLGTLGAVADGRVAAAARPGRAAAVAGPGAAGRQPRQQAGLLQPVLARRRARRGLAGRRRAGAQARASRWR